MKTTLYTPAQRAGTWAFGLACITLLLAAAPVRGDAVPVWANANAGGFHFTGGLYVQDGGLTSSVPDYWTTASFLWDVSWSGVAGDLAVYTYTFDAGSTGARDLSHFIIEVSEGLTLGESGNIRDVMYQIGSTASGDPIWNAYNDSKLEFFTQGQSIDNTLVDTYWLKFDGIGEVIGDDSAWTVPWTVRFESTQLPMWGNLKLKDGNVDDDNNNKTDPVELNATNQGFYYPGLELNDSNVGVVPTGMLSTAINIGTADSPTYIYGILVPDTFTVFVPEPSAFLLASLLGVTGLVARRPRRREEEA